MGLVWLVAIEEFFAPMSACVDANTHAPTQRMVKSKFSRDGSDRLRKRDLVILSRVPASAAEHVELEVVFELSIRCA